MWKVLQNCLPVKEVIHKRTGKGDPICEGCGEATETVEHLFFHCPIAEMTWKMAPVKWEGAMLLRDNIWRWWETVIQAEEENQGRDRVNITINLLWQLWKARNKRIFEHRVIEERDVVQVAQQEWLEFEMANEAEERMAKISIQQEQQRRWEPPKAGVIKINTDAAISNQSVRTRKGIIARNWTGN
ncbi:uncharacterized protein LOC113765943 [Coffea eugenioides]|uniref:uncharacterized protein LOC113765943 n=1 Tax=Coffea eugenioides TaxID=49369 RepID=UPI000F60A33B|nr:uncharacterized protein LOC113765943 [Coffea eugenioides]